MQFANLVSDVLWLDIVQKNIRKRDMHVVILQLKTEIAMKNILKFLIAHVFIIGLLTGCGGKSLDTNLNNSSPTEQIDSTLTIPILMERIEDMVEVTYANQCKYIFTDRLQLTDSNGKTIKFATLKGDGTVYMYFTPLECWECIKEVSHHIEQQPYSAHIIYMVPIKYKDAINTITNEAKIPRENIQFLSEELGLPIERENLIFFFTFDDCHIHPGQLMVNNVFLPARELPELTDIYFATITQPEESE